MINSIWDNSSWNRFVWITSIIVYQWQNNTSLSNPGTPVYFFASSLHMTTFGGTGEKAVCERWDEQHIYRK